MRGLVVRVDRDPETIRIEAQRVGQITPGKRDRFFLEIITEAEVAEHLEERMVTGGKPHILEVVMLAAHAETALDTRGTPVGPGFDPEKHILELDHACIREKERRILEWDERRRGNDRVAASSEIIRETLANGSEIQAPASRSGPGQAPGGVNCDAKRV